MKDEITLVLRKQSWDNIFNSIRNTKTNIHPISNFWAAIQHLESQYEHKIRSRVTE